MKGATNMDDEMKSELLRLKQSVIAIREWLVPNLNALEQSIDQLLPKDQSDRLHQGNYDDLYKEWSKVIKGEKKRNRRKMGI